ncbi:ribonuclease HII [Clostridium pasteurianum]|nr:ribonuclease HII [Clostridium pasteurianum]AOZ77342.1 ribonuclease HII [Clostridium pasteurianum DSM 525 = ATCC 6013]AOZ81139.1 ribonuclease HII [Clostridium pasteurianum]OMH22863.1 ribonuclease HII [Clostridium pasteurianum]UZW12355.1 ribonuclease HII [Clostridium pasteurianum]
MSYIKIKEYADELNIDEYEKLAEQLKDDSRKNVQRLIKRLLNMKYRKDQEIARVKNMYDFDMKFLKYGHLSGVDEVGRGPLAGPIVAAAVILDLNKFNEDMILDINDSKKLSVKKREELSKIIKEKSICFNISLIDNMEIDLKGIGVCNQQVLKSAAEGLKITPDYVISDGYPIKELDIPSSYAVKGDSKSASIACASIIAKVYRDNLMKEYAEKYPEYNFENNVGYGSKVHIEAIKKFGITPIHRKSFLKNII